jgi:hypothetical protein
MVDHVFVSYSRVDAAYVVELAAYLEARGVSVWYDTDIDYGAAWESEIRAQIETCAAMVVVMSVSARGRDWVAREIALAAGAGKPILPLLLEEDGVLSDLAHLQFDNVIGGSMPSLRFCRKLPGWLDSEYDIEASLSPAQRHMADRLCAVFGGAGPGGDQVAVGALQAELIRVGLDPGPVDGLFGDRTRRAVADFQRRRVAVAVVDGSVGILTCRSLVTSELGDLAPAAPEG